MRKVDVYLIKVNDITWINRCVNEGQVFFSISHFILQFFTV